MIENWCIYFDWTVSMHFVVAETTTTAYNVCINQWIYHSFDLSNSLYYVRTHDTRSLMYSHFESTANWLNVDAVDFCCCCCIASACHRQWMPYCGLRLFCHRMIIKLICSVCSVSVRIVEHMTFLLYFSPNLLCDVLFASNAFLIGNKTFDEKFPTPNI